MRKRILLTIWLSLPFIAISILLLSIGHNLRMGPAMENPRVGVGAGDTGGANAIGEWFFGSRIDQTSEIEDAQRGPTAILGGEAEPDTEPIAGDEASEADASELAANTSDAQPEMVAPESLPQGFVIVVDDRSDVADDDAPIHLASNHNGWNPGDANQRLVRRSDMRWQIVLPQPTNPDRMQFKFALGSWERVELSAEGEDNVPNRTLPLVDRERYADGTRPVFEFVVQQFREGRAPTDIVRLDRYRELDVTGTVRRLEVTGGAGGAVGAQRDLLVWLPPGYDEPENAERRYPVLYLMDGQNIFEQLPGVYGEWQADETAQRLVELGLIEPVVIVGVPHAGRYRAEEYLPMRALDNADPHGEAFVSWLRHEVFPRVERAFRVSDDPADRGIGGASFGAVISAYAAAEHPGAFGFLLLESMPTLAGAEGRWKRYLESVDRWPERVYIGMGGREVSNDEADRELNERFVSWARELEGIFARAGVESDRRLLVITPEANHNEDAWAERFPDALQFLLPPRGD
ncbi:MAG: esterase family protein [Phycisphaerales bacterium]|nr:esterase family protein [Phycisphaerales bacterium]